MNFLTRLKTEKAWMYLIAFLAPTLSVGLIFALSGVYPFGDRTILHIDMYHQYAPFFMELLTKLHDRGSLQFSWNIGIGSDFLATYAYYLASPLNFVLIFVSPNGLIECMTILVLVKIGLSGLSMCVYIRGHFGTDSPAALFPAILYALSGYIAAYYWDIMWLDAVALFPLVVLGLERVIRYRKSGLYAITLALSVWSNYYISFMSCVFLVLWFFLIVGELTSSFLEKIRSFGKIFAVTAASVGISAVLLLPELAILRLSGSGENTFPDSIEWYFSAADEASRHLAMVPVTETEGELPNLFCGAAVCFFLVLYVLNRRVSLAAKLKRLALLFFFLVSFNLNILDYLWHGLHFPEGLPARQAYCYIFLALIMVTEAILKSDGNVLADYLTAGISNAALFALVFFFGTDDNNLAILVTALFAACYIGLFYLARYGPTFLRSTVFLLALGMVTFEGALNYAETGFSTASRTTYVKNWNATRELLEAAETGDADFFRTEKYERLMKDENLLSDYPAVTLFSSLVSADVADFYKAVGMEGGRNFYCYNGATPLTSAMLSVRYLLADTDDLTSPMRTLIEESDGVYLYENNYTLPLGFFVSSGLEERWDLDDQASRVDAVNALGTALGATEELMRYQGAIETNEDGDGVFTAGRDGYYYAVHTNSGVQSMTVTVGERETTLSKTSHNYFLDLGYLHAGETATIHASNGTTIKANAYRIDLETVDAAFAGLKSGRFSLEEFSDTRVAATVDAPEAHELVFSIAAEPGWSAVVDGEAVEAERFAGTFLKLPLPAGAHEVVLTYRTPGLRVGILISLLCAAGLIVLLLAERRSAERRG